MPNPTAISTIIGISSFLGLLGLLGYLFFFSQRRNGERSVREIAEGEGLFNSRQILTIFEQFKGDKERLEALQTLADLELSKARILLEKIKENVDVPRLTSATQSHLRKTSIITAAFFLLIAAMGLAYKLHEPHPVIDDELLHGNALLDCGPAGRFTLNMDKAVVFGGPTPTYTQENAVPVYQGDGQYGFWMYINDAQAIRRYFLDRDSLKLSSSDIPMPIADYQSLESQGKLAADASRRQSAATGKTSEIRDSQQYVAQIDQLIGPYKLAHTVTDANLNDSYCRKLSVSI
nr:hypothetical protein [Luteibacter rhizovicinus]